MRKKKCFGRIAAFVLALSMVLGNVTPAYAADFSEVITISEEEIITEEIDNNEIVEEEIVEDEIAEEEENELEASDDDISEKTESAKELEGETSKEDDVEETEGDSVGEENADEVEDEVLEGDDVEETEEIAVSDNDVADEEMIVSEEESVSDNEMEEVSDNSLDIAVMANAASTNTIDSMEDLIAKFGVTSTEEGNLIMINANVELGGTITITEDTILLPEGKVTIKRGPSMETQHMFLVENGASLTLGKKDLAATDVLTIDGGASVKEVIIKNESSEQKCWVNQGSQAYSATAIYNKAEGTLVLNDGIVLQNHAIYTGDLYQGEQFAWLGKCEIASVITNFGSCTINGGVIQKNQAVYRERWQVLGGKDYQNFDIEDDETAAIVLNCGENAVLIMNDGIMAENFSIYNEPCIFNLLGNLQINGGELKGSTSTSLQYEFQETLGVLNCGVASFTDGKIHNFGIGIWNGNTVALIDSYPGENTYVPTLTMSGGRIEVKSSLKSADYGTYNNNRGIRNQGNFTMSGGTIWLPEQGGNGVENTTYYSSHTISGPEGIVKEEYFSYGDAVLIGGHIIGNRTTKSKWTNRSEGITNSGIVHIGGDIVIEGFLTGVEFGAITEENYARMDGKVSTISGGIIQDNVESGVDMSHPLNMTGGSILNNHKYGVNINSWGYDQYVEPVFTMDGGVIKGNGTYVTNYDGKTYAGICVLGSEKKRATFIMNGGLIKGNKSLYGSAIYGYRYADIVLNGGEITGNFAGQDKPNNYPYNTDVSGITDGSVYLDRYEAWGNVEDNNTITISDGKKDKIIHDNYIGQVPVEPEVTSMVEQMTLSVGQEESLDIQAKPVGVKVVYTSTNSEVASVDEKGFVTAHAVGEAKIYASIDDEVMAICQVYVKKLQINSSLETESLGRGETAVLTLVEDKNGASIDVEDAVVWKSDSEYVLSVEGNGNKATITGIGAGIAVVTATVGKNTATQKNQLVVTKEVPVKILATGIRLGQSEKTIRLPYDDETITETMKTYITPADANGEYVIKWKSDASKVVFVGEENNPESAEGTMVSYTAVGNGVANLTAELYEEDGTTLIATSAPCTITVTKGIDVGEIETCGVLTNTHAVLADIELEENYRWKEAYEGESKTVKLESYMGLQHFTAIYENVGKHEYQEVQIPVAVGTLTGANIIDDQDNSLASIKMEAGEKAKQTIYVKRLGEIYQLSEDYQITTTVEVTKGGEGLTILPSEETDEEWTIEATDSAKGKNYTVTATVMLPGADKTNKKQKGKLWFEKTLKVTVLKDGQTLAKSVEIGVDENSDATMENDTIFRGKEHLEKGNNTITLTAKVLSAAENDISSSTKMKWSTSNQTVATVDAKGKVTLKGIGTAIITATANDGSNVADRVIIAVKDFCPRLEQKEVTINCFNESEKELTFHTSTDVKWSEDNVVEVYVYDSKAKSYIKADDGEEAKFKVVYENGKFQIQLTDNAKVDINKKASYTLSLVPRVLNSDTNENINIDAKYGCALKVNVIHKTPKVTIKQSGKVNLFYKDAKANFALTSDYGKISKVEWLEGQGTDFEISLENTTLVLTPQIPQVAVKTDNSLELKKVDTKGKVAVYFKGTETPLQVALNVSAEYKKPAYVMKNGTVSMYPAYDIKSEKDTIIDKTTKNALDLSEVEISISEGFSIEKCVATEGQIAISTNSDNPAKKADLVLSNENNWYGTVSIKENIKVVQPKVVLSEKTVTLNKKNTLSNTEPIMVTLTLSDVNDISIEAIEGADAKTKAVLKDATLIVKKVGNNTISLGIQEYAKGEKVVSVAKGSYNLMITPKLIIGEKTVELAKEKLTVKVEEKAVTATVKGSGKINNLNRNDVSGTTYTVTMKNTSAKPIAVTLKGNDSNIVSKVVMNEKGSFEVYIKEDVNLKLKRTYQMTPILELSDGTKVIAPDIKLAVSQPSVKAVADMKSVTIYASEKMDEDKSNLQISIQSKDSFLVGQGRIANITCATKGFAYDMDSHNLYIADAEYVAMNKATTVKLVVSLLGEASGAKQVTVSVKADVKP